MEPHELAQSLDLPKRAIALVLAGGRGSRLMALTDHRAKPAVYFGGKFRIVDFALSNCLNSGIRRIGVITQYSSHSLLRHLQHGWAFLKSEMNEFVDLMPAQQRNDDESWYRGTADAVYQNQDILQSYGADYVVVLAGDHVYKMNYALMLADHVKKGRPCTVACIAVPRAEATAFGVMHVDENSMITDFLEKPADPPPMPGNPDMALASMGVYIFDAQYLYDELARDMADETSNHDFGKDIIPKAVRTGRAAAHPFALSCVPLGSDQDAYWRDVGTVDAYWDANIDLTATEPKLDMYDREWPIWTDQVVAAPAKFVHDEEGRRGMAISSLISQDCIVSGSTAYRSLLFTGVKMGSYSSVEQAVIMPYFNIGRGARLSKVIIDAGVRIPEGLVVGEDPELDAKRFRRTEKGVCLINKAMIAKLQAET